MGIIVQGQLGSRFQLQDDQSSCCSLAVKRHSIDWRHEASFAGLAGIELVYPA